MNFQKTEEQKVRLTGKLGVRTKTGTLANGAVDEKPGPSKGGPWRKIGVRKAVTCRLARTEQLLGVRVKVLELWMTTTGIDDHGYDSTSP